MRSRAEKPEKPEKPEKAELVCVDPKRVGEIWLACGPDTLPAFRSNQSLLESRGLSRVTAKAACDALGGFE